MHVKPAVKVSSTQGFGETVLRCQGRHIFLTASRGKILFKTEPHRRTYLCFKLYTLQFVLQIIDALNFDNTISSISRLFYHTCIWLNNFNLVVRLVLMDYSPKSSALIITKLSSHAHIVMTNRTNVLIVIYT